MVVYIVDIEGDHHVMTALDGTWTKKLSRVSDDEIRQGLVYVKSEDGFCLVLGKVDDTRVRTIEGVKTCQNVQVYAR